MRKISKKELKEITLKLNPFWRKYRKLQGDYSKKVRILEKDMNKKIKPKTRLEFFYCDGECVGIGAENYSDRKFFPLIQENELDP